MHRPTSNYFYDINVIMPWTSIGGCFKSDSNQTLYM